jgi:hypothetical protein
MHARLCAYKSSHSMTPSRATESKELEHHDVSVKQEPLQFDCQCRTQLQGWEQLQSCSLGVEGQANMSPHDLIIFFTAL